MHTRPLGNTGIEVSRLCLGTMTFGEQNSEAEAHEQLDRAVSFGIDFIDTAEMYPVPPTPRHKVAPRAISVAGSPRAVPETTSSSPPRWPGRGSPTCAAVRA